MLVFIHSLISADVTPRKRNLVRTAAVFQVLLFLLLLAAVIVLVVLCKFSKFIY